MQENIFYVLFFFKWYGHFIFENNFKMWCINLHFFEFFFNNFGIASLFGAPPCICGYEVKVQCSKHATYPLHGNKSNVMVTLWHSPAQNAEDWRRIWHDLSSAEDFCALPGSTHGWDHGMDGYTGWLACRLTPLECVIRRMWDSGTPSLVFRENASSLLHSIEFL